MGLSQRTQQLLDEIGHDYDEALARNDLAQSTKAFHQYQAIQTVLEYIVDEELAQAEAAIVPTDPNEQYPEPR